LSRIDQYASVVPCFAFKPKSKKIARSNVVCFGHLPICVLHAYNVASWPDQHAGAVTIENEDVAGIELLCACKYVSGCFSVKRIESEHLIR
jgi:hypothetical protein